MVRIAATGASLAALHVPSSAGTINTVLGYDDVADYKSDPYHMGAIVGPVANRIAAATAMVDGVRGEFEANDQPAGHCLHGGGSGLHRDDWRLEYAADKKAIRCTTSRRNGTGGFPGTVHFSVVYHLVDRMTLGIECTAESDVATLVNLASHACFNLDPDAAVIDDHYLQLHADLYTLADSTLIPTGEINSVGGTGFDLRAPHFDDAAQLGKRAFDTNFVIRGKAGVLRPAATLYSRRSKLALHLSTTQPGLQLYTGDHLARPFKARQGLCLEAQNFPDAPNQPGFPSALLRPGVVYRQRTELRFESIS